MSTLTINVICCDESPEKHSQLVTMEIDQFQINSVVLETVDQEAEADAERGLHNAAHHGEHGPVTYLQEVTQGGFAVRYGHPDQQQEKFFGAGSWVAFMDDEGPGHGSKVGPEGVRRTLRTLKGHLA